MPSRSAKISLLLGVDVVFFFIELTVGYAVGSLALVTDSFHMLNDVMSLVVALYAIKLSNSGASSKYSYGWHRAEIVAALINGVFLLALCFSIFVEAIERFLSTPEISNAKLIVIVGSLGLTSNFLGLLLFHEYAHSHEETSPKNKLDQNTTSSYTMPTPNPQDRLRGVQEDSRLHCDSFTDLYGFPAATRASVVQAALDIGYGKPASGLISIDHDDSPSSSQVHEPTCKSDGNHERSLQRPQHDLIDIAEGSSAETRYNHEIQQLEDGQNSHGHHRAPTHGAPAGSHGSMNMRALILHVVGDALANVGVIMTGLVIWLSTWEYKYYCDPIISLVITVIIASSALPLVRSSSFILLQAVPSTISLEAIREDIRKVPGVSSVHELHVWQLSEDKVVASVHVLVSKGWEYIEVALVIRKILHDHGVHSSTIQPEYAPPKGVLTPNHESDCLTRCPPNEVCNPENACCPRTKPPSPPLIDV